MLLEVAHVAPQRRNSQEPCVDYKYWTCELWMSSKESEHLGLIWKFYHTNYKRERRFSNKFYRTWTSDAKVELNWTSRLCEDTFGPLGFKVQMWATIEFQWLFLWKFITIELTWEQFTPSTLNKVDNPKGFVWLDDRMTWANFLGNCKKHQRLFKVERVKCSEVSSSYDDNCSYKYKRRHAILFLRILHRSIAGPCSSFNPKLLRPIWSKQSEQVCLKQNLWMWCSWGLIPQQVHLTEALKEALRYHLPQAQAQSSW